jgi:hypothetical protein
MKGVRDLHADAIAMQREGMLPHEVARRLIELGNDNGFTSIVHRNSPPKNRAAVQRHRSHHQVRRRKLDLRAGRGVSA